MDAKRLQIEVLCTRRKDYKEKIKEAEDEEARLKVERRDQNLEDEKELEELDQKL